MDFTYFVAAKKQQPMGGEGEYLLQGQWESNAYIFCSFSCQVSLPCSESAVTNTVKVIKVR